MFFSDCRTLLFISFVWGRFLLGVVLRCREVAWVLESDRLCFPSGGYSTSGTYTTKRSVGVWYHINRRQTFLLLLLGPYWSYIETMTFWIKLILVCTLAFQLGNATRRFLLGRRHGTGFVPPPPPEAKLRSTKSIIEDYFPQPLDHFNASVNVTWNQRYQVNKKVYKKGGPMFVMIGGEGPISDGWIIYGQMYQNAIKHGALIFQPEHRFYGTSKPTSDVSVKNLHYLSSLQALADLDAFIKGMKRQYNIPDAKVVVFGGSYAGNLAVWYRALYPNSSVGAVASSPPILAEVDFVEYLETVGNAQKYFNPECYDIVNQAFTEIQELVANKDQEQLKTLFGICGGELNFSDPYAVEQFYWNLIDGWMGATQYNSVGNYSQVAYLCETLSSWSGDALKRYSALMFNAFEMDCADTNYMETVNALRQYSWDDPFVMGGDRQWIWQTCTEFAYYQTSDSKKQPFGLRTVNIKFIEEIYCKMPFNISSEDIANYVAKTNEEYGGRKPNATNVFVFNGSIDPWHTLSVYKHDLNPSSPSRYIEGTSHCYDMNEDADTDPPALTKARQEMAETLSTWLA